MTIGLVFGGLYCAFLLLATSVFDAVVPIDERLLVPLVPTLAVAVAWLVRGVPVAALILVCVFAASVLQQVRTCRCTGSTTRVASGAPPASTAFCFRPDVSSPTGRLPWPISPAVRRPELPRPTDAHTRDRNDHFDRDMQDLARRVETVKRRSCS